MIRYWEEDTEIEIGRPFDLEKHDKEISDKWLEKVKQARKEIADRVYRYSGSGNEVTQAYCDGFKASLEILDKMMEGGE